MLKPIHPGVTIGHVHLKVADFERAITFYSEALYLQDPDQNGIELYWDRPESEWPQIKNDQLAMFSKPLDLASLLAEEGPGA